MTKLALSQDEEADKLLAKSPIALVIGLVLDQQITLEKAFVAPYLLMQRMGRPLDAQYIALLDPKILESMFKEKPALHRFPASMAQRVQEVCSHIAEEYDNDASKIWSSAANGDELFERIKKLPGFGEMKAKIFIALLGKQLGLDIDRWREVSKPFGDAGTFMSLADITDKQSLEKVREFKAAMKASAGKRHS